MATTSTECDNCTQQVYDPLLSSTFSGDDTSIFKINPGFFDGYLAKDIVCFYTDLACITGVDNSWEFLSMTTDNYTYKLPSADGYSGVLGMAPTPNKEAFDAPTVLQTMVT